MAQSFINLEDEALPSLLYSSLDSTGDHATLGNVTFGSGPGLPVAASTVYKIKAWADNRGPAVDASYLEAGQLSSANLQSSKGEQAKFSLSFKDDLDNVDDFIAAHRFSDMLVKIRMDESPSRAQASKLGPPPKPGMLHGQPTEFETDLSTGLLTFTQCGNRDIMERKPFGATTDEDCPGSDKQDSVPFSGSISSFLANEKLMSVDSINNDLTDDDLDMSNIPDDELEMYFKKLVPPSIQRGRVEGQEIPAAVLPGAPDKTPNTSTMDDCDQEDFRMLDVRLAATGMDSCPASDEEDTEDELEAVRTNGTSTRSRQLLPSTSRQLVGESNRPSFRPGLEGGSSDDEPFTGRGGPSVSGIEQRCSAEGQVINPPVTGNGGDGSSGSEESGNDGGVSTIPLTSTGVQAAYNMLRGLGMVGASGVGEDSSSDLSHLPVFGRNVFSTHSGMGDRVGPVGTGEASSSPGALVGLQRQSPVNWSMTLDRQEALTLLPDCCGADEDDGMDEADGATPSLSLWGGPSGDATNSTSEEDNQLLSTSLEAKYFSQTFHQAQEDSEDGWSRGPDGLNFPQDSVVYLNEEGKWVTDLAYYTSFEKVADGNMPENVVQFQSEDFLPAGNSIEKIINDQLEFEKEHQFMQEEQIEATSGPSLGEASWKPPVSGHILMRASQVSSEFEQGNRSYLRLSLGEFFQQRSEALGSLGNGHDTEAIKRPSFGYVITSPEKREPFALIRPSDFSSQDSSLLNITVELNEADQTLNTEDLDRTLEAPGSRLSPKGDTDPEPHEKEDPSIAAGLPFNSGSPGAVSDITNQSLISLNNTSTDLMLSISTIASAIADASISTDPSQLAVMIIELSKRRKAKSHLANARPAETASGAPEEPTPVEYTKPAQVDQSALHDTLQFDMEKYLRQADVSGSSPNSDSSVAHSTFNLTGWNSLDGHPAEVHGDSSQPQGNYVRQKSDLQNGDGNGRGEAVTFSSNSTRSSIPRPKASCIPKPLSSSARRSTGFGPSYTLKPSADGKAAATTAECHSPPANKGKPKAEASPRGASNAHRVALGTVRLQVSNIKASSASQKGQNSRAVSPGSQKTSPGLRKVRSGLPCPKASSPPCQKLRKLGQLQPEQGSDIQEKSTEPRSSVVSPSPHAGFACQSPQHTANLMFASHSSSEPSVVETGESPCNFRPSTSPLIHSSPSQTSFPSADSTTSPPSSNGAVADRSPGCELSPQSTCSSPSPSRLTYISINDRTVIPTPERKKNDFTMALSTTIIRASPTLPIEPNQELNCPSKSLDQLQSQQSKSLDQLPPHQGKSQSSSALGCTRSKSECSYHWGDPTTRQLHSIAGPLGVSGTTDYHQVLRPHQNRLELGIMGTGKPFSQHTVEPWMAGGLDDLQGQVTVPNELRFPHGCCVGIASQASLSLFNPSERWQQVSIVVTSLAIDGEKVETLPYQWLIMKNKTIIGPKSTEEQKVLFIPPQAGVYQCVLSVSSWPTSAESEVAARAEVFAKRVLLVAIAQSPAVEVDAGKSSCLDFGDLSGGSAKSLPLKLFNRTNATVPIRLVISANATAWRCFAFSKNPVATTAEGSLHVGHMTQLSSPSVMNHVMHATCGENPENFIVWVHFRAPQMYAPSGELGPADEYIARIDIEVDSPGPCHVIQSITLRGRAGTARVHAPRDLQTVSLSTPLGKSTRQNLPLKNAGNIDVQLKLKSSDADNCFSVQPDQLYLRAGEEQAIEVSFSAQGGMKSREGLLTILVLPSGPQYEVSLKGEVIPEATAHSGSILAPEVAANVPPILSNKQFVAWGGVTLGRAVQQKLVLRNNSPNATQQLRLLIRGQDQDCFQLQSLFSPEERLTGHGELSIRTREDVAVHLLFAPTRVACMLAKLEIKQSGVQPSQPGVKFTIPLSGYGGTSNIIVEDQRKRADGYVATMMGVAVGHVSKVCLCVRNTGSRAAFIKAVTFSDIQNRSVMDPLVISVSPSQFVLKERTQEVITVLMKSTQRELSLCQSADATLAAVFLFCGDEVSRQQYRSLLHFKAEAGRKVLSDNSLLKNINFNEKFLGEEQITETFNLPQRPNEAQIFYGNMNKVVVSLLGRTDCLDSGEKDGVEPFQSFGGGHGSEANGFTNGNVSLDVLPVKGPQGSALRVAEASLKTAEASDRRQDSWSVQPEQIALTPPTINDTASPRKVQMKNNTSRELSFELSWPAHCLTITPQHGVLEPQCQLQILISPNPSLATKPSLLPWSGQIYVQCDGTQKFIKVQIRWDLDLDVSVAPASRTLSALAPQAATPLLPVTRPNHQASASPLQFPQAPVEIRNKTIAFPTTPPGETSEAHLEVENRQEEVRWYLSSFAPAYVKGVDDSGDVYRATYTAFRCSRVSGVMGAQEKMQVSFTFLPRDRGDYAQFWDLECHPVSDPQQKTRVRFQLCGTGVKSGPFEAPQEGDCFLVRTEASVKSRKRAEGPAAKIRPDEVTWRGLYSPQELYTFPNTRVGQSSTLKVNIRNNSSDAHELKFVNPREPFHVKHSKYSLRSQHYLKLPVQFKPSTPGPHTGVLLIQYEASTSFTIQLAGEALP